jgi:hypothetical protein
VVRPLRVPDLTNRSASTAPENPAAYLSRTKAPIGFTAFVSAYVETYHYRRAMEKLAATEGAQLEQWLPLLATALTSMEEKIAQMTHAHVMWPWIASRVNANPVITARLLSRLIPSRAATPSAFWHFCGLATVPGVALKCGRCGHVVTGPKARRMTCTRGGRAGQPCGGDYVLSASRVPPRVAQRWIVNRRTARPAYDPEARTAAFLIGHDLIARSPYYGLAYKQEQERLLALRPGWSFQHRLRAARRRTTKRFLADLWCEWRAAEGLAVQTRAGRDPSRVATSNESSIVDLR